MKVTIRTLIETFEPYRVDSWVDLSFMCEKYPLMVDGDMRFSELSDSIKSRLLVRDYVFDRLGDCRSRSAEVVFMDEIPIAFFQNVGKGYVRNARILNLSKVEEIYLDWVRSQGNEETPVSSLDEVIELESYGATMLVVDNKIQAV